MPSEAPAGEAAADGAARRFVLKKVYLKGATFDGPEMPGIQPADHQPEIAFRVGSSHIWTSDTRAHLLLRLTLTATIGERQVFDIQVQQCGVFNVVGFDQEEAGLLLRTKGLEDLYPYARELVSDFIGRCGLTNIQLEPLTFAAMHAAGQLSGGAVQVESAGEFALASDETI